LVRQALDHVGLLSKIGRAFVQKDIHLHNASCATLGSLAEDMFYITDNRSQPITDPVKQEEIREEILKMLVTPTG